MRMALDQDFRKAEKYLWLYYGEYLGKGEIVEIEKNNNGSELSFTAKYSSHSGIV